MMSSAPYEDFRYQKLEILFKSLLARGLGQLKMDLKGP